MLKLDQLSYAERSREHFGLPTKRVAGGADHTTRAKSSKKHVHETSGESAARTDKTDRQVKAKTVAWCGYIGQ